MHMVLINEHMVLINEHMVMHSFARGYARERLVPRAPGRSVMRARQDSLESDYCLVDELRAVVEL